MRRWPGLGADGRGLGTEPQRDGGGGEGWGMGGVLVGCVLDGKGRVKGLGRRRARWGLRR